jgi:hypothetical protein
MFEDVADEDNRSDEEQASEQIRRREAVEDLLRVTHAGLVLGGMIAQYKQNEGAAFIANSLAHGILLIIDSRRGR